MTPHRTFRDDAARLWNAWDVIPAWGERRMRDRRGSTESVAGGDERRRRERRQARGLRIALPSPLSRGWIAFECGEERRRVAPIPEGWDALPEEELREIWRAAEQLPPRRKKLVE